MPGLQLKLYVTGNSRRVELAITQLRLVLDKELNGEYVLVVNDILQHPELAEKDRILATPTLIKELPLPVRRIIGDFSDAARLLYALDLQPPAPLEGGQHDEE